MVLYFICNEYQVTPFCCSKNTMPIVIIRLCILPSSSLFLMHSNNYILTLFIHLTLCDDVHHITVLSVCYSNYAKSKHPPVVSVCSVVLYVLPTLNLECWACLLSWADVEFNYQLGIWVWLGSLSINGYSCQ